MRTLREAMLEVGAWCLSAPLGGPTPLDYFLVTIAGAVVVYASYKALRHTLRPGERDRAHIKWRILDEDGRP